jgi:hypothetical protein
MPDFAISRINVDRASLAYRFYLVCVKYAAIASRARSREARRRAFYLPIVSNNIVGRWKQAVLTRSPSGYHC